MALQIHRKLCFAVWRAKVNSINMLIELAEDLCHYVVEGTQPFLCNSSSWESYFVVLGNDWNSLYSIVYLAQKLDVLSGDRETVRRCSEVPAGLTYCVQCVTIDVRLKCWLLYIASTQRLQLRMWEEQRAQKMAFCLFFFIFFFFFFFFWNLSDCYVFIHVGLCRWLQSRLHRHWWCAAFWD